MAKKKKPEAALVLPFAITEDGSLFATEVVRRVYRDKKHGTYIKYKGLNIIFDSNAIHTIRLSNVDIKAKKKTLRP